MSGLPSTLPEEEVTLARSLARDSNEPSTLYTHLHTLTKASAAVKKGTTERATKTNEAKPLGRALLNRFVLRQTPPRPALNPPQF